jgi:hypothetical protein
MKVHALLPVMLALMSSIAFAQDNVLADNTTLVETNATTTEPVVKLDAGFVKIVASVTTSVLPESSTTPTTSLSVDGNSTIPTTSASVDGNATIPTTSVSVDGSTTVPTMSVIVDGNSTVPTSSVIVDGNSTVPTTSVIVDGNSTVPTTSVIVDGNSTVPTTSVIVDGNSTVPTTSVSVDGNSTVPTTTVSVGGNSTTTLIFGDNSTLPTITPINNSTVDNSTMTITTLFTTLLPTVSSSVVVPTTSDAPVIPTFIVVDPIVSVTSQAPQPTQPVIVAPIDVVPVPAPRPAVTTAAAPAPVVDVPATASIVRSASSAVAVPTSAAANSTVSSVAAQPTGKPDDKRDQNSASPNGAGGLLQNDRPGQTNNDAQIAIDKERLPPSSAQGRQLLSVMPNDPSFNRDAAKSLPSGAPVIALAFNNNVCTDSDICSNPNGVARKQFEEQLKKDVVNALNTEESTNGKMRSENVVILGVSEVNGKTAAQFSILPPDSKTDMAAVVTALQQQTQNPQSPLMSQGLVTKNIDGKSFGVDVVEPLRNDGLSQVNSMDTATIVGISVGAYVGLVALFVGAHRLYVRRERKRQLDSARSHRSSFFPSSPNGDAGQSMMEAVVPISSGTPSLAALPPMTSHYVNDPSETFTLPRDSVISTEIDTTRDTMTFPEEPAPLRAQMAVIEMPANAYNTLMISAEERDSFLSAETLSLPRDSIMTRPTTVLRRPSHASGKVLTFDVESDMRQ